jgi:hypothetical protein
MKKGILLSAALLFLVATPLLAQDDGHSKKTVNCAGTISEDGQSFVCEKDHKTWKISNAWAVKDMEGHHAKLTYRPTSTAGEIFVTSAATVQDSTLARNTSDPAVPK